MKKYWLSIHANTFIWRNENKVMAYNTKTFESVISLNTVAINYCCDKLEKLDALYTIEIDSNDLKDNSLSEWIEALLSIHSATFVKQGMVDNKPVSLFPVVKIQEDRNRLKWEYNNKIINSIADYLHEFTIHISGDCNICDSTKEYHRQCVFPVKDKRILHIDDITHFLGKNIPSKQPVINYVGDVLNYPYLDSLLTHIDNLIDSSYLYITFSSIVHNKIIDGKITNRAYNIVVVCDVLSLFKEVNTIISNLKWNIQYMFLVTSIEEYNMVLSLINDYKILLFEITPIYTKENLGFFQKYIFIDVEDIKQLKLSKREIFAHQSLNTSFFGKIIILPDGNVKANINQKNIGTVKDLLYDLLYQEILSENSWFRIRNQEPCNSCIYQWICPSPSNYEMVIGKLNLCHVKP